MSSPPLATTKTFTSTPSFDEQQWVDQIRRSLNEELEDDSDTNVCIFNVPKALMSSKPEAYFPQQVALGPYHYWHPELYEMGRFKLDAAKRIQKQLQSLKFQHLVEQLTKLESRIRACYHKYLDLNGETLIWMMAVDTSFLLEFLEIFAFKEGKNLTRVSSRMSYMVEHASMKSVTNTILRDIIMLENQIPLFLLRKMLEFQFSSLEMVDEILNSMLIGLCHELSPFKMMDFSKIDVKRAHLLDVLYHLIVPKSEETSQIIIEAAEYDQNESTIDSKEGSFANSGHVKKLLNVVWDLLSKLNDGPIRQLKNALVSKPVKLVSKLLVVTHFQKKEDIKPENASSNSTEISKPPLMEEIAIPSVTQLAKSGVRFLPSNGDITNISFDEMTFTFTLPTVSLDVNTEVILRNLVAYEASIASQSLVFTRYTELMNGIIDTDEDAKLLRENGIILNHLKSDREVANMWNGMSKSVKLTKVPFIDKVIKDVNKYYHGRWKVKMGKFMKIYVFASWKILTFLAAIFLLMMTALQAFCSVYRCSRLLHIPGPAAAE